MSNQLANLLRKTFITERLEGNSPIAETNSLVPGERRDVAVLFLDLVGFTAFSELLDHETVHDITKALMDEFVGAAKQYSGYIDKIEGDRIMVLFGAITSGENNSKTAILCAFKMLEIVKVASSILSEAGVPIAAKIGINSGPVTVAPDAIGHLTAMGNTVNVASRMQEKAAKNAILVTDRVYSFCSENILWEKSREITVKGIGFPLKSWKPISINYQGNSIKCKESITTDFLIKKEEYFVLNSMLKHQINVTSGLNVMGGVRHLVVELTGEAGSGKTRLVSEFLTRECQGANTLILNGHSIADAQPAYYLWSTVIQNLLNLRGYSEISDDSLLTQLSRFCPIHKIRNSIPFLTRLISASSNDQKLNSLGNKVLSTETKLALRDLLTSLADNHQLIIVLDDLQWIDSTDSEVLNFIINNCNSSSSIYFILSRRSNYKSLLTSEVSAENNYILHKQILVSEFNRKEVLAFSNQFLKKLSKKDSAGLSEEALNFLIRHTSGNPFFLQELILHLLTSNGFVFSDHSWRLADSSVELSTPSSLTDLLQARLDRLPDPLRKAILNASILGIEFKLEVINAIESKLNLKPTNRDVFEDLVNRQFLENPTNQDDRFKFSHSFIQNTAYKSILSHNLKILHKAAARSIEELYGEGAERIAAQLADHWEKADDISQAIKWAFLTQNHSSINYQYASVLTWGNKLENWLSDLNRDNSVETLLVTYKRTHSALQHMDRKEELKNLLDKMLSLAEENKKTEWIAEAEILLGSYYTSARDITNSKTHLTEALKLSREFNFPHKEASALCSLSVLNGVMRQHDIAIQEANSAIKIFNQMNDSCGEARALGNLAILQRNMGNIDKAIPILEKVLQIFTKIGDIHNEAITLGNLGAFYADLDNSDKAQHSYSEAIRFFHKLGERMPDAIFSCNLANLQRDNFQFSKARERFLYAYTISKETGNPRLSAWIQTNFALLNILENQLDEALQLYEKANATFLQIKDRENQAISLSGIAYIYHLIGKDGSSLKLMTEAEVIISELKLLPTEFEQTYFLLYKLLHKNNKNNQLIPWPEHWEKTT